MRRAWQAACWCQPWECLLGAIALALLVSAACRQPDENIATVHQSVAQGYEHQRTPPTTRPAGAIGQQTKPVRPIAFVNDVPIERATLVQLLMEGRGLSLLQQLVLQETARQEAQRLGFAVVPEDVDREYDLTLQAARFDGKDIEKLTPARREQLIDEWTRSRGVTRPELAVAIARQAYLRKIAQGRVKIDEGLLQAEYQRTHGEKVEVRHIQLAAMRVWDQLKPRLDRGEDFAVLVKDFSQNALSRERNGLLPPFTADDSTVPAELAKAAFALAPGQVSNPIEAEGSYHVLKLERRIPSDQATFEEVQEELRHNLNARLVAEEMEKRGGELLMGARLRIEDVMLREQYKKRLVAREIVGPSLEGQ